MKKRIMLIAVTILCLLFMSWSICMAKEEKAFKDFKPPTISHDAPTALGLLDLPFEATFTFEDNKEVAYYLIQYDQAPDRNRTVYLPVGIVSQDFSVPLDFTNNLSTFLVAASDSAGNIARLVFEVTLDVDCPGCDLSWYGPRNSSKFRGIDFSGANLSGAKMHNLVLDEQNFSYANLVGTDFSSRYFPESWTFLGRAKFIGADLRLAVFVSVTLAGAEFKDADLTGADLTGSEIQRCVWDNTICPDGTNSDDHGNTCEGHLTP